MYYHFAILLLFRPFIKLRITGSSISPRDVCSQAADAIQGLLRSYSQLYTLRRTPSFVPYFVLTSSIMHLAIAASDASASRHAATSKAKQQKPQDASAQAPTGPPVKLGDRVTQAINQGVSDLTEMAPCHHFAEQALNILRYLANKWDIEIECDVRWRLEMEKEDEGKTNLEGEVPRPPPGMGGRMQDYEHPTRAVTNSLNFFAPNIRQQDYVSTFGSAMPSPVGSISPPVARSGESMENPLFWPFPMQGRPMLPSGNLLEEAGFEML